MSPNQAKSIDGYLLQEALDAIEERRDTWREAYEATREDIEGSVVFHAEWQRWERVLQTVRDLIEYEIEEGEE